MKNWSRIIDLGEVECVVRREGPEVIVIDFWMQTGETIYSPSVKAEQPYWLVNALFSGDHEERLVALARQALDTVQAADNLLEDIESDKEYSFTGPSLDLLRPPGESGETDQS